MQPQPETPDTKNLEQSTFQFPGIGNTSRVPRTYSLELFTWGIGQDVIGRKLLFLQEPVSPEDLSLPQLIAALELCYQPLDFDEDWLQRETLICGGLPEPETLIYGGVAPCVVNKLKRPRAALMVEMPYEHADMLDHRWSLEALLYRVYQATRVSQQHPQDDALFQGCDLHVEPLSSTETPQQIIRDRIPAHVQKRLGPEPIQRAELDDGDLYADPSLGLFGYDNGSGLILWVYDKD